MKNRKREICTSGGRFGVFVAVDVATIVVVVAVAASMMTVRVDVAVRPFWSVAT
jgi:hypothetical protein